MDVKQAINERRAYRSLEPVKITEQLVKDLAESAQLTPSCLIIDPGGSFLYMRLKLWRKCILAWIKATNGQRQVP